MRERNARPLGLLPDRSRRVRPYGDCIHGQLARRGQTWREPGQEPSRAHLVRTPEARPSLLSKTAEPQNLLKRLGLIVLLALTGCDGTQTPRETSEPPPSATAPASYVAVYFEHDGRLVPEYHALTGGEPPRELWDFMVEGPRSEALATALTPEDRLLQIAEPDEGRLLLELSDSFWSRPDAQVYRAAAQIVNTMGNLEEGREVTLIDGLRPGTVRGPDGPIVQPLTRDDFPPPLVQIAQPVAGSIVGHTILVDLSLVPMRRVRVSVGLGGKTVASASIRGGAGHLDVPEAVGGPATFEVEIPPDLTIRLPLEVAPANR